MPDQPLVAIVMPVYRTGRYLPEALDSVLAQTYQKFILVAVNDGSPDNSQKILDNYSKRDPRIIVANKPNGGVASARNVALEIIERSDVDYIGFLDSDDYLDINYIKSCINTITKTGTDAVFFATLPFDKLGERHEDFELPKEGILSQNKVVDHYFQHPRTTSGKIDPTVSRWLHNRFFSARILKGLRFNESLKVAEDGLYLLEAIGRIQKAAILPEFLINYRLRKSSLSRSFGTTSSVLNSYLEYKRSSNAIPYATTYVDRSIRNAWWHEVLGAAKSRNLPSRRIELAKLASEIRCSSTAHSLSRRERLRLTIFSLGNWAVTLYIKLKISSYRPLEDTSTYFD